MEFIIFLSGIDKLILSFIYDANFSVVENHSQCFLNYRFVGFYQSSKRKLIICTDNIKRQTGYKRNGKFRRKSDSSNKTAFYIRRAFRHEVTHAIQACNKGEVLDKSIFENRKLHSNKLQSLYSSARFSGKKQTEYEAYWMEDRPRIVLSMIKKYCL